MEFIFTDVIGNKRLLFLSVEQDKEMLDAGYLTLHDGNYSWYAKPSELIPIFTKNHSEEAVEKPKENKYSFDEHMNEFTKKLNIAVSERLDYVMDEIVELKKDATKRYGTDPAMLGSKGIFVDINRKWARAKRFLWDGETATSENIKDTLQDLAVISILAIMQCEIEGIIK